MGVTNLSQDLIFETILEQKITYRIWSLSFSYREEILARGEMSQENSYNI